MIKLLPLLFALLGSVSVDVFISAIPTRLPHSSSVQDLSTIDNLLLQDTDTWVNEILPRLSDNENNNDIAVSELYLYEALQSNTNTNINGTNHLQHVLTDRMTESLLSRLLPFSKAEVSKLIQWNQTCLLKAYSGSVDHGLSNVPTPGDWMPVMNEVFIKGIDSYLDLVDVRRFEIDNRRPKSEVAMKVHSISVRMDMKRFLSNLTVWKEAKHVGAFREEYDNRHEELGMPKAHSTYRRVIEENYQQMCLVTGKQLMRIPLTKRFGDVVVSVCRVDGKWKVLAWIVRNHHVEYLLKHGPAASWSSLNVDDVDDDNDNEDTKKEYFHGIELNETWTSIAIEVFITNEGEYGIVLWGNVESGRDEVDMMKNEIPTVRKMSAAQMGSEYRREDGRLLTWMLKGFPQSRVVNGDEDEDEDEDVADRARKQGKQMLGYFIRPFNHIDVAWLSELADMGGGSHLGRYSNGVHDSGLRDDAISQVKRAFRDKYGRELSTLELDQLLLKEDGASRGYGEADQVLVRNVRALLRESSIVMLEGLDRPDEVDVYDGSHAVQTESRVSYPSTWRMQRVRSVSECVESSRVLGKGPNNDDEDGSSMGKRMFLMMMAV